MGEKVLLGIILGLLAGSAAFSAQLAAANPAFAPVQSGPRRWLQLCGTLAPIAALAFIVITFVRYSFGFGLLSILEISAGATIAKVLPSNARYVLAMTSVPAIAVVWAVL